MPITTEMISGKTDVHLGALPDCRHRLHTEMVKPYSSLQQAAAEAGLDMKIASGFRSFEQQLAIWNGKVSGERPVLDDASQPLEIASLSDRDKIFAILRWSALPGASRHHWGTDIDVWDAAAVAAGYELQLTADEYLPGGPFHALSEWLSNHAERFGFLRPYSSDCGGIAPEPWHLSYRPVAAQFEKQLSADLLREVLDNSPIALKEVVLECLDEIYQRFVCVG